MKKELRVKPIGTCWIQQVLKEEMVLHHTDTLNQGNVNGKNWIPAECDVSIRPGWFYHKEEDDKVKTAGQLFDLYLKSVGRGANFLLNIPPDRRGLINEIDSASLVEFKKLREESFANNLVSGSKAELHTGAGIFQRTNFTDGNVETFEKLTKYPDDRLWIKFEQVKKINCIVLQEAIQVRVSGLSQQNWN